MVKWIRSPQPHAQTDTQAQTRGMSAMEWEAKQTDSTREK